MKKNDWLIIIGTAAYSFLFYRQSAGVNFLIFNIVLALLLLLTNFSLVTRRNWLFAFAGAIISSFFVFWWGTALPVFANTFSLLMLVGLSFNPQSSLIVAVINSCYSSLAAIPVTFYKGALDPPKEGDENSGQAFKKLMLLVFPVLITLVFYYIYKEANPAFAKITDKVSLNFISFDWIVFTVTGFILMFGVFRYVAFKWLSNADSSATDKLRNITAEEHAQTNFATWISVPNEIWTGAILFALLNVLLLFVNSVDVYCMWIAGKLPEGVTVADYLHDGTDTLIVSILMAIGVILFIFRGYLNFVSENKWLKLLCYGWIAQNAVLVITTANRNWWIIESSGLTRRRIGVYVYLLLCLIGLSTTFIKVAARKSNWFLFRKNGWAFYAVFIVACFFNWDEMIVKYNCTNFKSLQFDYIDRRYQSELSHTCLVTLFQFYALEQKETNSVKKIFTKDVVMGMENTFERLKKEQKTAEWKSFCVSKVGNLNGVEEMIRSGQVKIDEEEEEPVEPEK